MKMAHRGQILNPLNFLGEQFHRECDDKSVLHLDSVKQWINTHGKVPSCEGDHDEGEYAVIYSVYKVYELLSLEAWNASQASTFAHYIDGALDNAEFRRHLSPYYGVIGKYLSESHLGLIVQQMR
jgi:hypothetical protein